MKLNSLKIENFRGLNFSHTFSDEQFVVITGVNGSGKSTIIEIIELLLTRQTETVQLFHAEQCTEQTALLEVSVCVSDDEISYLAEKVYTALPGRSEREAISAALRDLFPGNSYKRRIEIDKPRPITEWDAKKGSVREFINDQPVEQINFAAGTGRIDPSVFNAIAQEMVIKFEQPENINLQFSRYGARAYSLREVFQPQNQNEQHRLSRTNVNLSAALHSLVSYKDTDESRLQELLIKYNEILAPLIFEIRDENGTSNIVLRRSDKSPSYSFNTASSGQKKAFALTTVKYVWEDVRFKPIVLLDEPENSLHPGLASRAFASLNELAESSAQPSFIVATHSPEVVAAVPNHVYRVVTTGANAQLEKIAGLDARASVLQDLGVHFHLDYVAQRIVFVESVQRRTSGEINDEEAYQRLIDPLKERVLFISVGNNTAAERQYEFQEMLFECLKISSPGLVSRLKDRDTNPYDPSCHTPFRHIEYLYVINRALLANAVSDVVVQEVSQSDIDTLFTRGDVSALLANEQYKGVWDKVCGTYRVRGKSMGAVQKKIVDTFNVDPTKRTPEIQELIDRYASS